MTLANRSLLSFSAAMALTALACAYSLYAFDRIADTAADVQRVARVLRATDALHAEALQTALLLDRYQQDRDSLRVPQIRASRASAFSARQVIRSDTRLERVRALLDSVDSMLPARIALGDSIITRVQAGSVPDAYGHLVRARDSLDARMRPHLRAMVALETARLDASLADADAQRARFRTRAIDLSALTVALIGLLSLATSRRITRRLMPVLEMAQQVRRGNFRPRVPVHGSDEIATLSAAFNHMAADLQELDNAKDEFVALASHQLRTPATAVRSNIAMLLDGYFGELTPEQREVLEDASASNDRQLHIVDDLLAAAQVETGRLAIAKEEVELGTLAADVVSEHRLLTGQRHQTVTLVRPPGAVAIAADAPKLKMALDNLVSNASKYTPPGGAIAVRVNPRPDAVEVTVEDTGVGIAEQDHERLFRKFSRIHNPLSRETSGTGLGLYLAHEIVKLHGGTIAVHSVVGHGTTFRITLPGSGSA